MDNIKYSCKSVLERMSSAAGKAGRDPKEIRLIVVTKTVGVEKIREAITCGLRIFGENRVQEALPKVKELGEGISWHMIGHLQTNKIKDVIGRFDLIHSVDSLHLCTEIDKRAKASGILQEILLEVNLSEEESKYGFSEDELLKCLPEISLLENISVTGLMTIPPFSENPEESRIYFKRLKLLLSRINDLSIRNLSLKEISMGMSNDFEIAIEEGATMVRIGTAIFGERNIR